MTTATTIRRTDATILYALDHYGACTSEQLADRAPASSASVADGRARRLAGQGLAAVGADGRWEITGAGVRVARKETDR